MSLLNFCIDSIALAALVYFTAGLALSLREKFIMPRPEVCPGQLPIDFTAAATVEPEMLTNCNVAGSIELPAAPLVTQLPTPDPWELPTETIAASPAPLFPPVPFLLMLPAVEPIALLPAARMSQKVTSATLPDWASMTPADLRKACQQQGIKWRNAHGRNAHLKKAEMIARLVAA